jgi:transcriptional adapter 3
MDTLQMEIEKLLVNIMQRSRQLKLETMILDNEATKSDSFTPTTPTLNKSLSLNGSSSSLNTLTPTSSSLNKKFKSFSGKPSALASIAASPLLNATNSIKKEAIIPENQPIVRNEIPDLFWQSVEPYCADITEDDVQLIENQIEMNDKYLNFNKIGPLGKHYTLQWAEDDIGQQIKDGSRFLDLDQAVKLQPTTPLKRKATSPVHLNENAKISSKLIDESLNKLNSKIPTTSKTSSSSSLNYGPLTQRLISALIEQNLMTPFDTEIADYLDKIGPPQPLYMSPKTMAKKFTFSTNSSSLERKIKRTLIEQGILDIEDGDKIENESNGNHSFSLNENNGTNGHHSTNSSAYNNEIISKDDEIALEIKNLQNELKLVTKQCKQTLVHLLNISKTNLVKQEVKKKISTIDNEVIDLYEKFRTNRLAKKPLTKKDKDKAMRSIKERQTLRSDLSQMKD